MTRPVTHLHRAPFHWVEAGTDLAAARRERNEVVARCGFREVPPAVLITEGRPFCTSCLRALVAQGDGDRLLRKLDEWVTK